MRHKITLRDWLLFATILFLAFLKLTNYSNNSVTEIKNTADANSVPVIVLSFMEDIVDIFCFCVLPVFGLQILLFISKGQAFHKKTIKHINILGWALVVFSLVPVITGFILALISHKQIHDIIFSITLPIFYQYKDFLLAGLIVVLIAGVFTKGKILKDEIYRAV
jgi:hypothetical protein